MDWIAWWSHGGVSSLRLQNRCLVATSKGMTTREALDGGRTAPWTPRTSRSRSGSSRGECPYVDVTNRPGRAVTREGQGGGPGNRGGHYNDNANNCTVGTGTLVHTGPCTAAELAERANPTANQADFDTRIRTAENAVRRGVNTRQLNQDQFDAMVSAAYNSGGAIGGALAQANADNDAEVAAQLRRIVMIHQHDAHGRPVGAATVSPGLVRRREGEVQQYNTPVAPAVGAH